MSDHDFEKQVQLKMEQLRLRPSSAVWAEVEKNIRRDKRRRRMIIWLPLLLLLLGAGGYYALQETTKPAHQDLVKQSTPSTSSSSTQNNKPSNPSSTQTQEELPASTVAKNNPQPAAPPASQPAITGGDVPVTAPQTVTAKTAKATSHQPEQVQEAPLNNKMTAGKLVQQRPLKEKRNGKKVSEVAIAKAGQPATRKEPPAGNDHKADIAVTNDTQQPVQDTTAMLAPVTAVDSSLAQTTLPDSLLKKDTIQAIAVAPSVPAPATNAAPVKKKGKTSKWQFGVQAEGGYSGVTNEGLFGFLENNSSPVADLASPSFNNAVNYAPQFPRPVNKPSNLTMGPAFSIGGFAQYTLSKRLHLSAGLQYTYLSTRQVVGTKVNNNRTVNRAPSTAQVVTEYYDADNTRDYTNRYHFIELPVTLHTQLNKGKRLPIIWDAGFSVSKLLNTNDMHYHAMGVLYYKDNSLFNKVQWNVSTGINFKFFQHAAHPLTVGPVMRYNISPLLQKAYSTGQHLWSVGLRAGILLKK